MDVTHLRDGQWGVKGVVMGSQGQPFQVNDSSVEGRMGVKQVSGRCG